MARRMGAYYTVRNRDKRSRIAGSLGNFEYICSDAKNQASKLTDSATVRAK